MSVETGFLSLAALVILLALRVPIGVALISIAFCGLLMCTKPVRSAADVKGLRIRAAGHTVPMTTALGASPINVPSSEIYEVLERGQVDCVFGPPNWLEANSLGEIAKYIVNANAGTVPNPDMLMLREDLWDDMSVKNRRLALELAPEAVAGAYFGTLETDREALSKEGAGYERIDPDASLKSALTKAGAAAFDDAVATAEEKGVDNAEAIATRFTDTYKRWQGLTEGIDTEQAYADLLRQEVFSRVDPES